MAAHSSSADDYRSVIDDLTIENKRLKEELKRYKQFGPDPLRKDKLFEIKFHGLPNKKKRELEATLRDFASSLEGSTTSSQQRKKSKHVSRVQGTSLNSKDASSSSSHSRPVDSAYASMSTGPSSIGQNASSSWTGRPTLGRTRSSADQKVESYLQDTPEGLLPRYIALTDKDKKKLVVRRLEQLFTGKAGGRNNKEPRREKAGAPPSGLEPEPIRRHATAEDEPHREARIQLHESGKKSNSREELSATYSTGDNEGGETRTGTGTGSGSGSNEHSGQDNSPQNRDLPEQRATKPLDLDPDRIRNPSENMHYIRHLGVTAPESVSQTRFKPQDVSMDADGWIHLNLLCNLAQLHIVNVTPDYIRQAVSERSVKFQLSRDGRKIRWRGGTEGTKFSSDSSGDSSQRSPETDGTDGSNEDGQRKRQKTSAQTSAHSSKGQAKLDPHASACSESFHYKPMFVHHQSSSADTSMDETGSQASYGAVENSNLNSRSTGFLSGSGSSPRKKRRRDGGIIYYTGAPFCLDLSGDPGDTSSPTTYFTSAGQQQGSSQTCDDDKPSLFRSDSGSSLPYRPLVDKPDQMAIDGVSDDEYVMDDSNSSDIEDFGFCWCDHPERPQLNPLQACLEPCGLGGVTPEDHFAILVLTRHPINMGKHPGRPGAVRIKSDETIASIANRLAGLAACTSKSPSPSQHTEDETAPKIKFQVLQQRYKVLKPLPLPPPAIFYPPFTDTTESEDSGFEDDYVEDDDDSDVSVDDFEEASQRANPHQSDQGVAGTGGLDSDSDENIYHTVERLGVPKVNFVPKRRLSRESTHRPSISFAKGMEMHPDSSGATAGEASGYSSGREESG